MRSRRAGVLTALLLTAALMMAMPGAVRSRLPADSNRMDERLRPSRLKMLTVWLLPGAMEDAPLIRRLCTAFEKERDGVRVFLRTARAEELYAPDAVLPDLVLFDTGGITAPEGVLLPLAGEGHPSGCFGGTAYALPLWLDVNVLCLPAPKQGQLVRESLLAGQPPQEAEALTADNLPWDSLLQPGAIRIPAGIALQQLTLMCPDAQRSRLPAAMGGEGAQVRTLREHRTLADGWEACVMRPAVSDRVRYIALCRDGAEAQAFVQFLMASQEPLAHHMLPLCGGESGERLMAEALCLFGEAHTLPNAFAHSRQGLQSLCLHAFENHLDPVETLLRLR